jgi:hypothetical protein
MGENRGQESSPQEAIAFSNTRKHLSLPFRHDATACQVEEALHPFAIHEMGVDLFQVKGEVDDTDDNDRHVFCVRLPGLASSEGLPVNPRDGGDHATMVLVKIILRGALGRSEYEVVDEPEEVSVFLHTLIDPPIKVKESVQQGTGTMEDFGEEILLLGCSPIQDGAEDALLIFEIIVQDRFCNTSPLHDFPNRGRGVPLFCKERRP